MTKNDKKSLEFQDLVNTYGYYNVNDAGAFKDAFRSTGVSTITIYLKKPLS